MVARIDVRSLVKRAKEERNSANPARDTKNPCDALAAIALRKHSQQQTCLDLAHASLCTEIQVNSLFVTVVWLVTPLWRFPATWCCCPAGGLLPARLS